MWQSNASHSKFLLTIPCQRKKLNTSSFKPMKSIAPRCLVRISLVALLGGCGATWLVDRAIAEGRSSTIAQQTDQASTAQITVPISREANESYESLLNRAEAVSWATTQRRFKQDISVTNVALIVLAENQGFIAPIVSLKVNRQQWQSQPYVQRWATYFPYIESLLGFQNNVTPPSPSASPTLTPTPTPEAIPSQPTNVPPGTVPPQPTNVPPGTVPPQPTGVPPGTVSPQPGTLPSQPTSVPPGTLP
ncbi:MAG: hypothetical protein KME08_11580 [Aphanothece sp. CMT-3BRIN-NPC111]|jgi:hypothetical protein|nr:hypothetical protein [Aphanothece sp. CMT-3BRIN-NPC111]